MARAWDEGAAWVRKHPADYAYAANPYRAVPSTCLTCGHNEPHDSQRGQCRTSGCDCDAPTYWDNAEVLVERIAKIVHASYCDGTMCSGPRRRDRKAATELLPLIAEREQAAVLDYVRTKEPARIAVDFTTEGKWLLDALQRKAWIEGRRAGTSRAMRQMSDEPGLPLATDDDCPYPAPPADSPVCRIPCDDDCEAPCHAVHMPQHHRVPEECGSRGPRIGEDGTICRQPKGHPMPHRTRTGHGNVSWWT